MTLLRELESSHLHQTSTSTLLQLCDDACDTVLIEISGVALEWVATQFQASPLISMRTEHKRHRRVIAATTLTFTLGVNRPLGEKFSDGEFDA